MSIRLQHMREAWSFLSTFVGKVGEIVVDTSNHRMIVHDGATAGGWPAAKLSEVLTNARTAVADVNYTVLAADHLVAYTALTAPRVVGLPAAAIFPTGTRLTIIDESGSCSTSDTITLACAGSDTINGSASAVIASAWGYLAIESNGADKWTLVDQPASNLAAVGIATPADPANPLTVYGANALFNSGGDIRVKLNKAAPSNTASFLFQDGFSGRAEIGLTGDDNFHFKVSPDGTTFHNGITIDNATGAVTLGNAFTAVADANYTALATDRFVAYTSLTAGRVLTLPSAAAFAAGTPLRIADLSGSCSASATLTINRTGSDTINGVASAQLSSARGFVTLICDGASQWIVCERSANIVSFTSSGTYTPSPGMTSADVYLFAAGGGGGGGCLEAISTACSGGGGGGGGGCNWGSFATTQIGAAQTVTVDAGGAGGAAATSSTTAGGNGGAGGATSFGSLLAAGDAGSGAGGQLAAIASGGGSGGGLANGVSGLGATGGASGYGAGAGGSGASAANTFAQSAGGGGGGSSAAGVAGNGGSSSGAAPGGGAGGGLSASNVTNNGARGGGSLQNGLNSVPSNGGAAGGPVNGGAGATPSTSGPFQSAGWGGGGGASATTGTAGNGGAGGFPGGGGGGGGSAQNGGTAGTGGAGGAGLCIIVEHF